MCTHVQDFTILSKKPYHIWSYNEYWFIYARLSVNGGSDKHSFRKDSAGGYGRSRYSKSPEQMDGTFSMTTIEEEQENLSIALSLKNLSQIDDRTSIHSLKECSDD